LISWRTFVTFHFDRILEQYSDDDREYWRIGE